MTNEELISKYYDGNMQALYDLYEQNVGFIQSVAAAVAKDYKNYLRFSDTFEDLVQVGSLTFFEKLKAKKYDARKGSLLTYLTPQLRYAMQEFIENFMFIQKADVMNSVFYLDKKTVIPISQKYKDAASCIMKVCQIRIYPRSLAWTGKPFKAVCHSLLKRKR